MLLKKHIQLTSLAFLFLGFIILTVNASMISFMSFSHLPSLFSQASAQAFCALRHPHKAQQKLFPHSTHLQTFTNKVTHKHRDAIQDKLSFSIHVNELGLHTLYAVFKQDKHIGFIHVRSEKGEWGLIEIAWALTPDLRIKDFVFQRCRESARLEMTSDRFKTHIYNLNFRQLKNMLHASDHTLKRPFDQISSEGQKLAVRMIHSALKTIAVTREVWPTMLKPLSSSK